MVDFVSVNFVMSRSDNDKVIKLNIKPHNIHWLNALCKAIIIIVITGKSKNTIYISTLRV